MLTGEFNQVVANRVGKINSVLAAKAGEYSSGKDRLHNFKVAARVNNETPERSLWGMMSKHLVSVIDIVDATAEGVFPSDALRDEKIGDAVNYLILLEALLIERKTKGEANGQ